MPKTSSINNTTKKKFDYKSQSLKIILGKSLIKFITLTGELKESSLIELGEIALTILNENCIKKPSIKLLNDVFTHLPTVSNNEHQQTITAAKQTFINSISKPKSSFFFEHQLKHGQTAYLEKLEENKIYVPTNKIETTEKILNNHVFNRLIMQPDHPDPANRTIESCNLVRYVWLAQICDNFFGSANFKVAADRYMADFNVEGLVNLHLEIDRLFLEKEKQWIYGEVFKLNTTITQEDQDDAKNFLQQFRK